MGIGHLLTALNGMGRKLAPAKIQDIITGVIKLGWELL